MEFYIAMLVENDQKTNYINQMGVMATKWLYLATSLEICQTGFSKFLTGLI